MGPDSQASQVQLVLSVFARVCVCVCCGVDLSAVRMMLMMIEHVQTTAAAAAATAVAAHLRRRLSGLNGQPNVNNKFVLGSLTHTRTQTHMYTQKSIQILCRTQIKALQCVAGTMAARTAHTAPRQFSVLRARSSQGWPHCAIGLVRACTRHVSNEPQPHSGKCGRRRLRRCPSATASTQHKLQYLTICVSVCVCASRLLGRIQFGGRPPSDNTHSHFGHVRIPIWPTCPEGVRVRCGCGVN